MKKRNLFRDAIVYLISSCRDLLFKGHFKLFLTDISSFRKWRQYRNAEHGTLYYKIPWLVFGAIDFLDDWLLDTMQVFEYGSGGSTLFFGERTSKVISIEHNKEWYSSTKGEIDRTDKTNIHYQLIEPAPGVGMPEIDVTDPFQYVSGSPEYRGLQFRLYVQSIDTFPDASFDLIVIDGRVRHSCIAHAMKKVKTNGVLLVDNADREHYLKPFPELRNVKHWTELTFIGHFPYGPASILNTTKIFINHQVKY